MRSGPRGERGPDPAHGARALRGQEGHRRPGPPARAAGRRPARARPPPRRGRARAWPRRWPSRRSPASIGGEFKRIQFTPDLVPADLVGTRIYNQKTGEFSTSLGPVFTNLLLADEINRAPAKVQSALLEVMQEHQVTIGRETFKVPDPFLVLATQNPIETEGTYALPEAQVDRFMLKVLVGYPTPTEEFVIVERMTGRARRGRAGALDRRAAGAPAARPTRSTSTRRSSTTRSGSPRPRGPREPYGMPELERYITFGASPRASINLILTARALAFVRGRDYACPRTCWTWPATSCATASCSRSRRSSDNVTERRPPDHVLQPHRRPGRPATGASRTSASAPERILQRLDWQVIRRLDGLLQGDYRSLFHGNGVDLADLREYQPGDDVRYIDWNVTARMDTPVRPPVRRGPRDHRLVPARPQPVGRLRHGRRRSASSGPS